MSDIRPAAASASEPGIVVLISGRGSNLQSLIDAERDGRLGATIRAVISNRPDALGLQRARDAGIAARVLDPTGHPDRDAYDRRLIEAIDAHRPALVVLAGFMRILSVHFVAHYAGRLINIHPSLLPDFRGLRTHQRALAEGVARHGASVHFVTEELDGGPVILQARVPVFEDDTPETLAARVLEQEHRIYPRAVERIASGRITLAEGRVLLDGKPLETPALLTPEMEEPQW
ncbi:phosphoribosylglycinamide formyltransferase [Endothiovibrio diazotrophicus]